MIGVIIIFLSIILGIVVGLDVEIPYVYSKYIAVAILACLDSVFGAYTANLDNKFNIKIFISGFFGNAIISILLVFIGEKLDVEMYLAAVIVFTTRLLNNFTILRRVYLDKIEKKVKSKNK